MKRVWRKVIALILVLLMVLQMLPDSGFRSSLAANTNTATEVAGTPENSTSTKGTKAQTKDDSNTETGTSSEAEFVAAEAKTTEAASTETEETKQEASDEAAEQKEMGTTQEEEKTTAVSEEQTTAASEEQTTTSSSEETSANTTETEPADSSEEKVDEEEKTEQKEETPKTSFTYEDNRVVITAEAGENAAFPQDTELHADYMKLGSDAYNNAVAAVEAQLAGELKADKKNVTTDYVFYDIYFLVDGERIEPAEGKVKVTMDFKSPVLGETDGEVINTDVVHVDNNGEAEIVTDKVESNKNGKVTSASFKQSSFSPVGIVVTRQNDNLLKEVTLGIINQDGVGGQVTNAVMLIYYDGAYHTLSEAQDYINEGNSIPKDANVYVSVDFEMGENTYLDTDSQIIYNIPQSFVNIEERKNIDMTTSGRVTGQYDVVDNVVTITPDKDVLVEWDNKINTGSFTFWGKLSEAWWSNPSPINFGGNVTINASFLKPVVKTANVSIEKTAGDINYADGTIDYTLTVTAEGDEGVTIPDVTVKDVCTIGNNISASGYLVYQDFKSQIGKFENGTWTIGNITITDSSVIYEATYTMKLADGKSFYDEAFRGGIKNTATVYSDQDAKDSATVTITNLDTLNITKTVVPPPEGQSFYTDENGNIWVDYAITVSAPNTNSHDIENVKVQDVFADVYKNVDDILEYQFVGIQQDTEDVDNNNNGRFNDKSDNGGSCQAEWTVGTVERGKKYTLTYKVKINPEIFDVDSATEYVRLQNTATVKIDGHDHASSTAYASQNKTWLKKQGHYIASSQDRKISFTITVNDNNPFIIKPINTITDQLVGDYAYDTNSFKISLYYLGGDTKKVENKYLTAGPEDTNDVVIQKEGRISSWTLNLSDLNITENNINKSDIIAGKYKIVISYEVTYDGTGSNYDTSLANRVSADIGPGENISTGWWFGEGGNEDMGSAVVTKRCVSQEDVQKRTPSWESTIPVDVYTGSTFTDTVADSSKMYITPAQFESIVVKIKDASKPLKKGEDYKITGTTIGGSENYSGFKIEFLKDILSDENNPITITYNTTIETSHINADASETYKNNCKFVLGGDHSATSSAQCTYTKNMDIQKTALNFYKQDTVDGKGNTIEEGTMRWRIDLNEDGNMYGDADIVENLPDVDGNVQLKDILVYTGNEQLVNPDSQNGANDVWSKTWKIGNSTTISLSKGNGNDFTIAVNNLQLDQYIRFEIVTEFEDYSEFLSVANGQTIQNEATLQFDSKTKDSTAQFTTQEKISKTPDSSDPNNWPRAEYTVVLNPDIFDLGEDTWMTFTDNMVVSSVTDDENNNKTAEYKDIAAKILPDTIQVVYTDKDGNKVTASRGTFDAASNNYELVDSSDGGFELKVADDKKVEITYQVEFAVASGWKVKLENTASYSGYGNISKGNDAEIEVHDAVGTLTGGTGKSGISLKKTDSVTGDPLQGAVFQLEQIYTDQDGNKQESILGEYTSNKQGIVNFENLDKQKNGAFILYRYKEVTPPTGYQENDTEYYFAFGDRFGAAVKEYIEYIEDKGITFSLAPGGTIYEVENELIYGNIEVTKKLSTYVEGNFDEVIDLVADEDKTIYVGLFTDNEGTEPYNTTPYGDDYDYVKEIEIKKGESTGSVIYENLPIDTYYVFETDEYGKVIKPGISQGDSNNTYIYTVTVDKTENDRGNVLEIKTHCSDDKTIKNRVTIENMYYDLPDGYSYEASILINKTLLNGSETYDTSDTFYAAVFEKTASTGGEGTTAPGQGGSTGATGGNTFEMAGETYRPVSKVLTLKNNDTYEIGVPLGGTNGDEPITYYVFETDADGNPIISIDADGKITYNQPFAYDITLESTGEDGKTNNRGEVYVSTRGEQAQMTITNQATSVTIEKRDTDGNPLSGATLELWKEADSPDVGVPEDEGRTKAANGDVLLETWVTDGTPHVLTAELAVGGKYYLRETGVPSGYLQAADMLFTVEDAEPITIVMEDRNASYANGRIQVTKRLSTIDQEMFEYVDLIAKDTTFYVGLFTDAAAEHPYGTDYIKEIHVQDASSQTITYDNLPSGTYYVFEVEQDGTVIPYREAQSTTVDGSGGFYCNGDGSDGEVKTITIDLDKENKEGSTELNNVYYGDLPDGFAYQGELSITKSIIKDGAPAESSDVFYAGIFTSETETTPYKVVTLENNGTVTVEVPLGGENGMDPITYYIYETDANGNKLDKNAFAYDVSGEGTVALDKNNTSGTLTIVNTIPTSSETTRTITEKKDKSSGGDSSGTNRSTSASKTGDDSRTGLWLLFFTVAAAGIVIILRRRGRHSR